MCTQKLHYELSNFQEKDFDEILKLYNRAEQQDLTGRSPGSRELREKLNNPRINPQGDLLTVKYSGEVVAFLQITPERDIGRLILSCVVDPGHRGKGLSSLLLNASLSRAEEMGISAVQVCIPRGNNPAASLLQRKGFVFVRTFLELRAEAESVLRQKFHGDIGLVFKFLSPGEESLLMSLQNRCFEGTWGFNPNKEEDIYYGLSSENASYEDVLLAYREDEPVGYCWMRVGEGDKKGKILMLGVLPGHRGKGIAQALLISAVKNLYRRGVKIVELTADSGNPPACRLYFSAGFKVWSESFWFAKELAK